MPASNIYEKDLYQILGVSKSDNAAAIKKRYRTLARELHPDKTKGDKKLEEKFKEVSEAYEVLSDDKKRKEYDEMRDAIASGRIPKGGFTGQSGGPGFNGDFSQFFSNSGFDGDPQDIFSSLFGQGKRSRRGPDLETQSKITFRESVFGKELNLTVRPRNSDPITIKTRIPAGIKDGAKIRLKGRGGAGDGGNGDLYITINVETHPIYSRDNLNLLINVPITFTEATLGADIKIPTLENEEVTLRLPAGTQSGKTFRVKGRGIKTNQNTGDLLVTVQIQVPQRLDNKTKELISELAEKIPADTLREDLIAKARI